MGRQRWFFCASSFYVREASMKKNYFFGSLTTHQFTSENLSKPPDFSLQHQSSISKQSELLSDDRIEEGNRSQNNGSAKSSNKNRKTETLTKRLTCAERWAESPIVWTDHSSAGEPHSDNYLSPYDDWARTPQRKLDVVVKQPRITSWTGTKVIHPREEPRA